MVWYKKLLCSRQQGLAHQHNTEHGKNEKRANSWLFSTNIKISELEVNVIAKSGQDRSHGFAYMKFKGYFQDKRISFPLQKGISKACQRSFLPLQLRFQEHYFEQWICYVSEIIIGQIMTFRNTILMYLSQIIFENRDSSVEH